MIQLLIIRSSIVFSNELYLTEKILIDMISIEKAASR